MYFKANTENILEVEEKLVGNITIELYSTNTIQATSVKLVWDTFTRLIISIIVQQLTLTEFGVLLVNKLKRIMLPRKMDLHQLLIVFKLYVSLLRSLLFAQYIHFFYKNSRMRMDHFGKIWPGWKSQGLNRFTIFF